MKTGTRNKADVRDPIHSGKTTFVIDGSRGFRSPARPFRTNLTALLLAIVPTLVGCTSHQVGPNRPVAAATKTAAPIPHAAPRSPVAARSPRKVFAAPAKSAQERAPAPQKPSVLNPSGLGAFEQTRLSREEIQDYQSALCLPRDGSVASLRKGAIDFFRRKDVDDPERAALIEQRGLLQGDMDELSKLSVNLHCGRN